MQEVPETAFIKIFRVSSSLYSPVRATPPNVNYFPTKSMLSCATCYVPEVSEALLVLEPGPVEADGAVEPLLDDGPAAAVRLHVAEDLEGAVLGLGGDPVHAVLPLLQDIVL